MLVNNAGTNEPALLEHVSEEDYDAVMDLNVRSLVFLTQAVAGRLRDLACPDQLLIYHRRWGTWADPREPYIVRANMRSKEQPRPWPGNLDRTAYGSIHSPTFILTPMSEPMLEDKQFRDQVVSSIALGRIGQVEDIMGRCRLPGIRSLLA